MQYLTQDDSYEKTVRTWGGRRGWQGKNYILLILSVVSHAVNTVTQLKAGKSLVRTSLKNILGVCTGGN